MAVHGPYKNKTNAKDTAAKYRKKGYKAGTFKTDKGWKVSVTKK